jgi:hypothetical protein
VIDGRLLSSRALFGNDERSFVRLINHCLRMLPFGETYVWEALNRLIFSVKNVVQYVSVPQDAQEMVSDNGLAVRMIGVGNAEAETDAAALLADVDATSCKADDSGDDKIITDDMELIKPMMDSLPSCLSLSERRQVESLLLQYVNLFARSEYDVGCTQLMKHRLQLVDSSLPSIRENLRRHPISYLDRIDVEVGRLLKADIVEEANDSPWASNVVLVLKRPTAEGQSPKFRITVDFRNLNNRLVGLNYPIGETSSVINSLQKAKFFHCLDLANAYLGLPLDESTSELTSFVTRRGVFKFKRLAAGLCTAPGAYAQLVNMILGDLDV